MTLQRYATTAGVAHGAMAAQPGTPVRERLGTHAPVVRDLRERAGRSPRGLHFAAGDVVVVSGLPGSGKSTLIRRAVNVRAIDSQDTRDRWARRMPRLLPYALYRPLVRVAHYGGLCARCAPVTRSWSTTAAPRRGYGAGWPGTRDAAAASSTSCCSTSPRRWRGRASASADAESPVTPSPGTAEPSAGCCGTPRQAILPPGCCSAVLLDREAAGMLTRITFADTSR